MKAFVAVTDREWFAFLRGQPGLTEVNFWLPTAGTPFRALQPGHSGPGRVALGGLPGREREELVVHALNRSCDEPGWESLARKIHNL